MTEKNNNLHVVQDEQVASEVKKTTKELALQGIDEICQKYGIKPMHIAECLSQKLKESTDMLKNEANMYDQNLKAVNNKILYKELLAREINAMKVIDNHNSEMQEYQKGVIDTILGWIKLNAPIELKDTVGFIEQELGLPYQTISNNLDQQIHTKAKEIAEKLAENKMNELRETTIKNFLQYFINLPRSGKKEVIAKYSK